MAMRCRRDDRDAIRHTKAGQLQAFFKIPRAVVNSRQNMAMEIDHSLFGPKVEFVIIWRTNRTRFR